MQTNSKNKVKIILDIIMSLVFAVLFNKMVLGGLSFHEIAGLSFGAFIILHTLLNRAWIKGVSKKIFSAKLPTRTRIAYIVDFLLLAAIGVIIVTGILISKVVFANVLGINANVSGLHKAVSYVALMLVGVHLGLSWERVINIIKKLFKIPKSKVLSAMATLVAIVIFSVGSYNIASTEYFGMVASITSAFSGEIENSFDNISADYTSSSLTADAVSSASIKSGGSSMTSGSSSATTDTATTGNGALKGKGQQGNSGILAILWQNISIISAFAVFTYYIDKLSRRKKVLKNNQIGI